ncbi:MAG: very short patch repair endonuclease [Bacteroidales bacterium]|nr:very short patch repair endonuclease [Bacteroidales bacterium]
MDKMTPEQRHRCMSAVRSRDTRPERLVRQFLWTRGFRYRLYRADLPGRPDIVFPGIKTVIFIHGCFWHGHHFNEIAHQGDTTSVPPQVDKALQRYSVKAREKESSCFRLPKTNPDFWLAKIRRNRQRDQEVADRLRQMGWNVITIWECELAKPQRQATLERLAATLEAFRSQPVAPSPYSFPPDDLPLTIAAEDPM